MKRLLIFLVLLSLNTEVLAQGNQNPRLYYRQFNNEYVKIQRKDMMFRLAHIREEDREKVQKYREAVIKQIAESRTKAANMHPFKESEILIEGYTEGLDTLALAYTDLLDTAFALQPYQYESPQEMADYYERCEKAEEKIAKAFAMLEEIEDEFAIVHNMGLKRDEDIEKQYKLLKQVHAHTRSLSLSFYRVDHAMQDFLESLKKNTNVNLDTFLLVEKVKEIRSLAREEKDKAGDYRDPELEKDLYKELVGYIKTVSADSEKSLMPIAQTLEAEPFHTNGHRDARIDLDFFVQAYDKTSRSFVKARSAYVSEYFPE